MKTGWFKIILCFLLVITIGSTSMATYPMYLKEQLYSLYHLQLNNHPIDINGNIHWLEMALRADFANPLYALARIENEEEWEKYRYLFTMHLNLKLVEMYLLWGSKYQKQNAYFFNYPWQDLILEALDKAESFYRFALLFWEDAKEQAELASQDKFRWMRLEEIEFWEGERFRIVNDELNYERIINRHIEKLEEIRSTFEAMDENTY